jgi:excisionase family DNA binding protein
MTDDPFWTVIEVTSALRVSKMTVYRLARTGELEHVRIGRSIRFRESVVLEYMKTGSQNAAPSSSPAPVVARVTPVADMASRRECDKCGLSFAVGPDGQWRTRHGQWPRYCTGQPLPA